MAATAGDGAVPASSPSELLAAVPGLAESLRCAGAGAGPSDTAGAAGVSVVAEELRRLPGASVGFADLYALISVIEQQLADPAVHGIVVTQGTDTIEESAYLLDLYHRHPAPVVVTGAMRNPSLAGPDGPANLLAAVQVAASEQVREYGVLVVFADEIHAASRVRKTHATSVGTFQSPNGGPLGYVVEGVPRLLSTPSPRYVLPVGVPDRLPRVGLLTVTLGDDGALVDALADRVDGLVVAGFGAGHVPEAMVEPLARLAGRKPVVLASRTGAGPVLAGTYGFAGSERDLLARGLISAGFLQATKARVLLHGLLAGGADRATTLAAFVTAGGGAGPSASC